jgi:hypothetical protein
LIYIIYTNKPLSLIFFCLKITAKSGNDGTEMKRAAWRRSKAATIVYYIIRN